MGATTQRRKPAPPEQPRIQVGSSQAKHWRDVSDYNAKITAMVAAKKYTPDNAPYASPTTSGDDLNKMIRNSGVEWNQPMPAEEGLHSGSNAVDVFNRPQAQTPPGRGSTTTTTVLPQTQPSAGIGASTRSASRIGASTRDASAIDTTVADAAPRTTPDGTAYAPHIAQLIGTPLPPDVAQTIASQNRAASQPSATPAFLGASSRYASNGNFDTRQAVNDYAKGNLTQGQLSAVYDDASTATNRQGGGILPATQAADAASRRQPGGSPYGMVPVDPSRQSNTYISDGSESFNGKVYPAGTPITLGPGGKKIIGSVAATMQVPGAPVAATPAAPATPASPSAPSTPAPSPQVVAASNTNAEAFQNQDFNRESATGPIAQAAQAKLASAPVVPTMEPPSAPSSAPSAGTSAGLALRSGVGSAVGAIRSGSSNAVDSTLGAVGSGLSNTADFGRALVGLPQTDPAARQASAVDAVKNYPANNPGAASQVKAPGTTSSGNVVGGYDLSAYNLKPPATPAPAPGALPAPATPAAPDGSPLAPHLANLLPAPAASASVNLSSPAALTLGSTATPAPDFDSSGLRPQQVDPDAGAFAGPADNDDDEQKRQAAARQAAAAAAARNQPNPNTPPVGTAPATRGPVNAGIGAAGTLQSQGFRNIDLGNNGVPVAGTNAAGQRVDFSGGPSTAAGQALNAAPTANQALGQAADPGKALNAAPTADQALANASTASQALARPGQQTDTGGPVSDAASALNKRTGADQALNPGAPPASVTPGSPGGFMSDWAGAPRSQSLNDPASLSLTGTATNNGATDFSNTGSQLPAGNLASSLGGDYATPAGVAKSDAADPSSSTPRTTAPNPMAGAGTPDNGTPLGDDEEMGPNGVKRKKLQPSTSPAAPGPTSASSNNSAPAAPGGSGGSGGSDS